MRVATGPASVSSDATADALYEFLSTQQDALGLEDAQVFFNFPLYRDDDRVVSCRLLLASRNHGIVVIGTSNATSKEQIGAACRDLSDTFGHVYARLFKNPKLKRGMRDLRIPAEAFLYAPDVPGRITLDEAGVTVARSGPQAVDLLRQIRVEPVSEAVFEEALSTVEGAKGLIRPRERNITNPNSKAAAISRLEEETNRFDLSQKEGYLADFDGPQRIRGLAGSGKTIVLAMKAALTLLRYPDAKLAFTFHTKSLYQHVQRLITRFYRQYDDRDPDWGRLHVLHSWGGKQNPGMYSNACANAGVVPMTFSEAQSVSGKAPFDTVCSSLLKTATVTPVYDFIFVDEGQDFPASFLQLCLRLAKGERIVFAYDQLQTIFQPTVPTISEIFGRDDIELSSDVVLRKCYRNPLEVLVTAHAVGFGLYGPKIVQMLENEDHWSDLGYEVVSGKLESKRETTIRRPAENSPSSISSAYSADEILAVKVCADADVETTYVADAIHSAISDEGLKPEDILVVAADDRFAKPYLRAVAAKLAEKKVRSNNLQVDTYGLQDFVREDHVTLASVHKAKGNEAYMVFVLGIDALFNPASVRTRNMAFTAMTRAKAWLRVSGIGDGAREFAKEVTKAKKHLPDLVFEYPSEELLVVMKRDLQESDEQRFARMVAELRRELPEEEFRRLLQKEMELLGGGKRRVSVADKKKALPDGEG